MEDRKRVMRSSRKGRLLVQSERHRAAQPSAVTGSSKPSGARVSCSLGCVRFHTGALATGHARESHWGKTSGSGRGVTDEIQ